MVRIQKKPDYPCSVCGKNVNNNHPAILCSICNFWSHNKCNMVDAKQYRLHQLDPDIPFYCLLCKENNIPMMKLNDFEFFSHINKDLDNVCVNNFTPTASQQEMFDRLNAEIDDYNTRVANDENELDFNHQLTCNYYDTKEFLKSNFCSNKNFSVLHLNIHSIQKHIEELTNLLIILNHKFDILAICESKLNKDPITNLEIPGYQQPIITKTESTKGGTMLYVANGINFKPRKDLEIYDSKNLESTFIEIINPKESNHIVGVVYRHPNMNSSQFIDDKLNSLFGKLSLEQNNKIYIAGDFNYDLLKTSQHQDTSEFYDKITSNLFIPLITVPTKINRNNNTLIDNILTNEFKPDTISGNLTVTISDHLPSFVITPRNNRLHVPKKHNIYLRNTKNFDRENFILDILDINWDDTNIPSDVNQSFNHFIDSINRVIDKYMPLKKLTKKEYKRRLKPWITPGILNSIDRKNKLYKRYSKTKSTVIKTQLFTEYKTLRNALNDLIHNSKQTYYKNYFLEHNTNLRKIWDGIKEIVNIKTKNYSYPASLQIGNNLINDPSEICNEFNNYFVNIADNILKGRKYGGRKHFSNYLNNQIQNSFAYEPCDTTEVITIINELDLTKASGPNGIPTKILQLICNIISQPLCKIINDSITTGVHPDRLKLVNVIPIFKKGSRLLVSNYRPISLLSNLNKIFEKIMYKRIYGFIERNSSLYSHQFGFRAKHSTTHALIDITEKIRKALDDNKVACGIFVDLQKAFDTVNHDILLDKLKFCGFRGIINEWFRSYLHERKQKVCINGFESQIKTLNHGVPQGSVLGPILF